MSNSLNFHIMPFYFVVTAEKQPHRDRIWVHLAQYPVECCSSGGLKNRASAGIKKKGSHKTIVPAPLLSTPNSGYFQLRELSEQNTVPYMSLLL